MSEEKIKWTDKHGGQNKGAHANPQNSNKNPAEKSHVEENKAESTAKSEEIEPQTQMSSLQEKINELQQTILRTLADKENTKKRLEAEKEQAIKYSVSTFAKDLITSIDNLFRAVESVNKEDLETNEKLKAFLQGVEMTKDEFIKAFRKHGLERIHPMGESFNPNYHQAISQIEHDGEEGKVLQIMQAGYKIHDRVLSPAIVVVSKRKQNESDQDGNLN